MTRATALSHNAYAHTSAAIANLRGVFIIILVSFHSCLPYLGSTAGPATSFEQPPFQWLAYPIVDDKRFFGFDLYCAWEDVHVMALMYFLSGLFVVPSLRRKGPLRFAIDRSVRLAVPFLFSVLALMPIAIYAVYRQFHPEAGFTEYLAAYSNLPFLPNGPQWFLWLLLAFSLAAAALFALAPQAYDALAALANEGRRRPQVFLLALTGALVIAYVPLTLVYGPFDWFERGPFAFQISRPFLYGVYFFAGGAVGAAGLGEGLLAQDGALSARWRRLGIASPILLFLWMGMTGVTLSYPDFAPLTMRVFSAFAYVGASVAGVMLLVALAVRFCAIRIPWLEPLAQNALGIFVVHYAPMVWMQYALMNASLPAFFKAVIVFAVALSVALACAIVMRRQAVLARLIGEDAAVPPLTPRPVAQ